jgi:hypothetical protein
LIQVSCIEQRLAGAGREKDGQRVVGGLVLGQAIRQIDKPLAGRFPSRFVAEAGLHAERIVEQHDPLELRGIQQAGGYARW